MPPAFRRGGHPAIQPAIERHSELTKSTMVRSALGIAVLSLAIAVAGCNGSTPPMSKQEQQNFNPGPPGPNVDIGAYMKAHGGKGGAAAGGQANPGGAPGPAPASGAAPK